jgi:hypothetical protein
VHLCIILVSDQLDETVSTMICLFESSTCFEQLCAHPQEDSCINTTSGIISPCYWPSGMQVNKGEVGVSAIYEYFELQIRHWKKSGAVLSD